MRRLFAICVFMFAPGGAFAAVAADQQRTLKAASFDPFNVQPRTARDGVHPDFSQGERWIRAVAAPPKAPPPA
jgi:hypothetical protein